jgi:hypothetical protein
MKILALLIVFGSFVPAIAQKAETMTIKIYFHPDNIDKEWMDCQKVAPVNRIIPKTAAVATAARSKNCSKGRPLQKRMTTAVSVHPKRAAS